MPLPALLERIVGWLRAGYPEGVPERDYLPLFALLGRQLAHADLHVVADELALSGQIRMGEDPSDPVRRALEAASHTEVSDADVARVREHLEGVGWQFEPVGDS